MKLLEKILKYKTKLSYCLKCKKYAENINPRISKTFNNKTMLLSKCPICNAKKSKLIKEQEASKLLSSLGIKTLLNKIPLFDNISF